MRAASAVLVVASLAACGGAQPTPGYRGDHRDDAVAAPTAAKPPPPLLIQIPTGWTDLLHASRDDVEAIEPGLYDQVYSMAERNHYLLFAIDLRADSDDQGAMMTML